MLETSDYNEKDIDRARALALSDIDEVELVDMAMKGIAYLMADLETMKGTDFMARRCMVMIECFVDDIEGGKRVHMAYETFKEIETL